MRRSSSSCGRSSLNVSRRSSRQLTRMRHARSRGRSRLSTLPQNAPPHALLRRAPNRSSYGAANRSVQRQSGLQGGGVADTFSEFLDDHRAEHRSAFNRWCLVAGDSLQIIGLLSVLRGRWNRHAVAADGSRCRYDGTRARRKRSRSRWRRCGSIRCGTSAAISRSRGTCLLVACNERLEAPSRQLRAGIQDALDLPDHLVGFELAQARRDRYSIRTRPEERNRRSGCLPGRIGSESRSNIGRVDSRRRGPPSGETRCQRAVRHGRRRTRAT